VLTLNELMTLPPLLDGSRAIRRIIRPPLAEFLDANVGTGSVTLETGAGLSTLVILRKQPRQHTAVMPDPDEAAAVLEIAEQHGMNTRGLRVVVARSQDYVPTADLPALDLVLLGGDHAFPVPFVEWYYTAERLVVGGLMIVDDIRSATRATLADFMRADRRWREVVRDNAGQFAVYQKRAHSPAPQEWTDPVPADGADPPERPATRAFVPASTGTRSCGPGGRTGSRTSPDDRTGGTSWK
jgi:Methyltransferase domain